LLKELYEKYEIVNYVKDKSWEIYLQLI
jgi:hypothetical protein